MSEADFLLTSHWRIPAPLKSVWSCLIETEEWPRWWTYVVRVENISAGTAMDDNRRDFLWHTCLPYDLAFRLQVVQFLPYRLVVVEVEGDLSGTGSCTLNYRKAEKVTELTFEWKVSLKKTWMKRLAAIAKPLFIWNHRRVMKIGEQGLIGYLTK